MMSAKPTSRAKLIGSYRPIPWRDFQLIGVGYLALLGLVAAGDRLPILWLLRLALALVYLFFVSGYCLTSALLSRPSDLTRVERAALSTGLSIALIPVLALILDALPWGLATGPIVAALGLTNALFGGCALAQRVLLPTEPPSPPLRRLGRRELGAIGVLLAAALLSGTVLSLIRSSPPSDSRITEFYALGDAGLAEGYPRVVLVGQPVALTLGLVNRETGPLRYRAEARVDAALVGALAPIELTPGASWEGPFSLRMPEPGADQRVEILLFVEGRAEPYRRLTLWLNVRATPAPTG